MIYDECIDRLVYRYGFGYYDAVLVCESALEYGRFDHGNVSVTFDGYFSIWAY